MVHGQTCFVATRHTAVYQRFFVILHTEGAILKQTVSVRLEQLLVFLMFDNLLWPFGESCCRPQSHQPLARPSCRLHKLLLSVLPNHSSFPVKPSDHWTTLLQAEQTSLSTFAIFFPSSGTVSCRSSQCSSSSIYRSVSLGFNCAGDDAGDHPLSLRFFEAVRLVRHTCGINIKEAVGVPSLSPCWPALSAMTSSWTSSLWNSQWFPTRQCYVSRPMQQISRKLLKYATGGSEFLRQHRACPKRTTRHPYVAVLQLIKHSCKPKRSSCV